MALIMAELILGIGAAVVTCAVAIIACVIKYKSRKNGN